MTTKLLDSLAEENPEAVLLDGYESAFIGISRRCGQLSVAAYSYWKIIDQLRNEMSFDDAVEFFEHNIGGAWFGEHSPVIVELDED